MTRQTVAHPGPTSVPRPERTLLLAAAIALVLLVLLALCGLLATGRADGLDAPVLSWVRSRTGPTGPAITVALALTALGNDLTLWLVSLSTAGYLAAARQWGRCAQLIATTGLGGLLTSAFKAAVARPRPSVVAHLVEVHSASFPSGHAMNSGFVYGTTALLAVRCVGTVGERRYLLAVALTLIAAVGVSRVVLGVHWPSDVLGGWAIGLGWSVGAAALFGRLKRPVGRPPELS